MKISLPLSFLLCLPFMVMATPTPATPLPPTLAIVRRRHRIILSFAIVIVNCLILCYKLGRQVTSEEPENSPRDIHSTIAKESKPLMANVDTKPVPVPNIKEAKPVIAFLRISKTGSTTLSALIDTLLHGLYTQIEKETNEEVGSVGDCLYTYTHYPIGNARFGSNNTEYHQCFHGYYAPMVKQIKQLSQELHYDLQPRWISMIRDPYDRLVSLFHFSKDNFLYRYSSEQEEMIKNDDLQGWLETLTKTEYFYISLQHIQFNDGIRNDLEKALTLIEGERPIILTLVNECFEASLRLFVEEFLGIEGKGVTDVDVDVDIIQDFISGNRYNERKRPQQYVTHEHDNDDLRSKAKEWFRDDFIFYDKAVEHFKERMKSSVFRSGGDLRHFESCKYYEESSDSLAEVY